MAGTDALQMLPLSYGDPIPEALVDAAQEVLGTLGRLDLTVADAVTIRALAGPGADEAGQGIGGALRWMDANVDRAMPAGAAGRYDVYVTTGPTTIVPGDPPTDTTDYSWALAIVAGGAAPATAYAKRVGYLDWSGTAITRLVQTFGRRDDAPVHAVAPTAEVSALEAIMPGLATAPPIRAQVGAGEVFHVGADGSVVATGTLSAPSAALSSASLSGGAGALALAAGGSITFGGDVELLRQQVDVLRTHDNFWADFNIAAGYGSAGQTTIGGVGAASAAGILMNDTSLYRSAAGTVRTDGQLSVGGTLTAGTLSTLGSIGVPTGGTVNFGTSQMGQSAGGSFFARAIDGNGNLLFGANNSVYFIADRTNVSTTQKIYFAHDSEGSASTLMVIQEDGTVGIGSGASSLAGVQLGVVSTAAANLGVVSRGAAGQTGDLIQAQFSNGSNAFRVDSSGNTFAPGYGDLANAVAFLSTNTDATHGWVLTSKTSAKVPFTVKAAAAQAQNLTEWQDFNGTMLGNISAGGAPRFSQAVIGPTSTGVAAGVHLLALASAVGNVPLVARGSAGQTGDLTQWQDSTSAILARFTASGALGFGPGAAADTLLYRPSAGLLRTDSTLSVNSGAGGKALLIVPVAASPNAPDLRFGDGTGWQLGFAPETGANAGKRALVIYDSGKIEWKVPATGASDATQTNLYRSVGVSIALKTDANFSTGPTDSSDRTVQGAWMSNLGGFFATRSATSGVAFRAAVVGDTQNRFTVDATGGMSWGPGGATALDTTLYRPAANALATGGNFYAPTGEFFARQGAAQQVKIGYVGTGKAGVTFGAAEDANLYRSAAGALVTDGSLDAGGGFKQGGARLPGPTIAGTVNADGTIANGTGFTVAKTGAGTYTITITEPGWGTGAIPVWTGNSRQQGAPYVLAFAAGNNNPPSIGAVHFNATNGGAADGAFFFMATRPQ